MLCKTKLPISIQLSLQQKLRNKILRHCGHARVLKTVRCWKLYWMLYIVSHPEIIVPSRNAIWASVFFQNNFQNADNIKQVGNTDGCTIEDKLTQNEKDIIGINNIARILHSKLMNFDVCIVGSRTFKNVPPSGLIVPPSGAVFLKLLLRYQYELCTAWHLYGIHTWNT